MHLQTRRAAALIGMLAALLLVSVAWNAVSGRIDDVRSAFDGDAAHPAALPLDVSGGTGALRVEFALSLPRLHAKRYVVYTSSCVTGWTINGQTVRVSPPPCNDDGTGDDVDLAGYLQSGKNSVTLSIAPSSKSVWYHLSFYPSRTDPLFAGLLATGLAVAASIAFLLMPGRSRDDRWLGCIVLAAVLLRIVYTVATPPQIRGNDWSGHLEYVLHVAEHGTLPAIDAGWQTHQPPLYYGAAGLLGRLGSWGTGIDDITALLQLFSVLCAIAVVWTAASLSKRLFASPGERLLFTGLIAAWPAFTFLSSRVSNDTLATALGALSVLLLVRWHQNGSRREWLALCAVLTFGVLTKQTIYPLIGASVATLCVRSRVSKETIPYLAAVLLPCSAVVLGLTLLRGADPGTIVANIAQLDSSLRIPLNLSSFLSFNPLRLLAIPYNNDYSDAAGRAHLWEYIFRSVHFGSFPMGRDLLGYSRLMLTAGLLQLPLFFMGIAKTIRRTDALPLLLILLLSLGSMVALRYLYPFSSSQDIRYILPSLFAVAYILVRGRNALSGVFRTAFTASLVSYILLCAGLPLLLFGS